MIDPMDAMPGFAVFYQRPHMQSPEYGVIKGVALNAIRSESLVHVLFLGDTTAKACYPRDLHWPPDFCIQDRVNPPGQIFNRDYQGPGKAPQYKERDDDGS